ncbi:uncharacterized protein [Dermacentor albipictus]|uniref:uncharacterized protein isoform X4 n=1 Tax=Dermacentor albipictus TaxID=60249 RepID=UPI0038FC8BC7
MRVCRCFQTALLRLETSEASGSMSAAEFQLRRVLSVPLETFGGIGLASSTFSSTAAMASATVGQLDIPKSTVGSGFVCPSNNPADRMDVRWPRAALPSFYGGTFQMLFSINLVRPIAPVGTSQVLRHAGIRRNKIPCMLYGRNPSGTVHCETRG